MLLMLHCHALLLCRSAKSNGPVFATRVTPQGHIYVQPEAAAKAAMARAAASGQTTSAAFQPTNKPSNSTGGRRGLRQFGADGRIQITSRPYPFSAVGHVTFSDQNNANYICSGALVGPSTVFTAGKHQQADASNFCAAQLGRESCVFFLLDVA